MARNHGAELLLSLDKELLKAAKIPCHAGLWSTLKIRRVSGISAESRQEDQYGNGFTGTQEADRAKHLAG
ncbi:MAG TPA: hypothetical protein VMV63_04455 [Acidithiobacillus sp.]|nr:hypothetical protein [Acidithiobacillus sp.]